MQYHFGTGTLWGAATADALGNTIANPTPIKFGTLSDVSLEIDRDIKELYGQLAFPVALGGGKMKVAVKAKFAQIAGRIFNDLFLGQGLTAGTLTAAQEDLTGQAIPIPQGLANLAVVIFFKFLPIALPLIAGVAAALRSAKDSGRRKYRYKELAQRLQLAREQLIHLKTESSCRRCVNVIEEILLDELIEWHLSEKQNGSH